MIRLPALLVAFVLAWLSPGVAGEYALRGKTLEAVFDSATGRVSRLAVPGGENSLVLGAGIELRTAQQVQVRFITGSWQAGADPSLSSGWSVVRHSVHELVAESAISPLLGLRARQVFRIDPAKPRLTIETTLTRTERNPFPVHIWQVIAVPPPQSVNLWTLRPLPNRSAPWIELSNPGCLDRSRIAVSDRVVTLFPGSNRNHAKIGALGDLIEARYPKHTLVIRIAPPLDRCYPDASSIQVYSEPGRVELETLSDNRHLRPGQQLRGTTVIELRKSSR